MVARRACPAIPQRASPGKHAIQKHAFLHNSLLLCSTLAFLRSPLGFYPIHAGVKGVGIFSRELAQDLLCAGLRKGLFSEQSRDGWPCNIWAQLDNRLVLEARLDSAQGTYHGFPI